MNNNKKYKPTESELDVLSIIWENGPSNVRFVNDALNRKRSVGYTTTLKIMQIMFEKGILSREVDGRTHIYQSEISQKSVQGRLVDRLLETAFGGSASNLVMSALGNHNSSKEELMEIKNLIQKLEEK